MKQTKFSKIAAKKPQKTAKNGEFVVFTTGADLKTAVLIVSLALNAFMVCLWVALQVSSQYDQALVDFFIHR
jgi:hypothetical protein